MVAALKNHWITGLALLGAAFMVTTGIAMMATGGDFDDDGVRVYGVLASLGGLVILGGLWGLWSGRLDRVLAQGLIVVGMLALGVLFWWFVLVPPVVALAVLWAGVVKKGLVRELRTS